MSNSLELLVKNTRITMKKLDITQADLADRMGITQASVNKYLTNKINPGLEVVEKFASALGLQPWELMKPEGAEPSPLPGTAGEIMDLLKGLNEAELKIVRSTVKGLVDSITEQRLKRDTG